MVLEAGARDKDKFIHIPAAFAKLFRSAVDWNYLTEPQKELDGRAIYWPRGKMLGGSSSMNAMMWVRGFAADYDEWGELAGAEWDYARLEPYLQGIEAGPLVISPQRSPRSSTAAWLTAVQECGYRVEQPQLRCAGRLLRDTRHAAQGRAVEYGRRLPQADPQARNLTLRHRGHRDPGGIRR